MYSGRQSAGSGLASFALFQIVLLALLNSFAVAEPLIVRTQGSVSEFTKELKAGEKATLTVHLKSLGDPVLGFEVALRDGRNGKPLQVLSSNENGIVTFTAVEAGTYQIAVQKKMNDRGGSSSTTVGDIVFKVIPASVADGEN